MTVQLELWQLITLLISFFTAVGAFGRVLLGQIDKRFAAQDQERLEAAQRWMTQFDDIDRRLDAHGERVARVEVSTSKSPTHDDLAALHRRIDAVAGAINGLQGEFKGASHTLHLIHEYLLKGSKEQ